MNSIQKVESFQCSICKKLNTSQRGAEVCFEYCSGEAKKESRKQRRVDMWDAKMNQFRNELENVDEIAELLAQQIKRHFGAVVKLEVVRLRFTEIEPTYDSPVGKTIVRNLCVKYLGWEGIIKGRLIKKGRDKNNKIIEYFSDLDGSGYREGIKGLNLGTGGGGSNDFSFQIRFYLDDFPKLKAKYSEFQKLKKKSDKYLEQKLKQDEKVVTFAQNNINCDEGHQEITNKIEHLEKQILALQLDRATLYSKRTEIEKSCLKEAESKRDTIYPISDKYKYDEQMFYYINRNFQE